MGSGQSVEIMHWDVARNSQTFTGEVKIEENLVTLVGNVQAQCFQDLLTYLLSITSKEIKLAHCHNVP